MDWSGLEVVADYFSMEEMRQEVRRRKEQELDKELKLRRETKESHMELMGALTQLMGDVVNLTHVPGRGQGGHPRPGGPHPPNYPDPNFPYPGPDFF